MTQHNGPMDAFAAGAGILPADLSLLIRTLLLAVFFIWSAWCVIELMKGAKTRHEHVANLLKNYAQVFFLVSVVIALVFLS